MGQTLAPTSNTGRVSDADDDGMDDGGMVEVGGCCCCLVRMFPVVSCSCWMLDRLNPSLSTGWLDSGDPGVGKFTGRELPWPRHPSTGGVQVLLEYCGVLSSEGMTWPLNYAYWKKSAISPYCKNDKRNIGGLLFVWRTVFPLVGTAIPLGGDRYPLAGTENPSAGTDIYI